jgi:hypothetical protein
MRLVVVVIHLAEVLAVNHLPAHRTFDVTRKRIIRGRVRRGGLFSWHCG